jgi:hypothetical protein
VPPTAFLVWGFPFETLEDLHQSLFQMVPFRMLGARIPPRLTRVLFFMHNGAACRGAHNRRDSLIDREFAL